MSTPSARTGGSLDAWFKISLRGSTVRQEVVAGLTTFPGHGLLRYRGSGDAG